MARKFILALTGASGSIYFDYTLRALLLDESIDEIAIIISDSAREVMDYEGVQLRLNDSRITLYDNNDFFAPTASGSSLYEAMIIVPCSTGTLGRLASGVCSDLIARSGDVMLKERRKLILALRESPLSLIHLNNMTLLAQCGATIMPLSPGFYPKPKSMDELCKEFANRIALSAGAKIKCFEWGKTDK
ncbi:MAG: UbiX family flavin prenyltransferase [Rikenellaceae bacterium]